MLKILNKKQIKKLNKIKKTIHKTIVGNEITFGFTAGFTIMSILTITIF